MTATTGKLQGKFQIAAAIKREADKERRRLARAAAVVEAVELKNDADERWRQREWDA